MGRKACVISVTSRMSQTGVRKRKRFNSVEAREDVERANAERGPFESRQGD